MTRPRKPKRDPKVTQNGSQNAPRLMFAHGTEWSSVFKLQNSSQKEAKDVKNEATERPTEVQKEI